MIRRWAIQCDTCECTDVAHEMDDGDMVFLDDIKPLIERLATFDGLDSPVSPDAHDDAVRQLRGLLSE